MAAWAGWESDVLRELGLPDTDANRRFLATWQRFEGGTAAYNPLNTTLGVGASTAYNAVGVRNYPSRGVGVKATAATLSNARYAGIRRALATGDPFHVDASTQRGIVAGLSNWVSGTATGGIDYANRILGAAGKAAGNAIGSTPTGGAIGAVGDAVTAPAKGVGWVLGNWDRVLLVIGGFLLLVLGLLRLSGRSLPGTKAVTSG